MSVNMIAASLRCSLPALIARGGLSARRETIDLHRFPPTISFVRVRSALELVLTPNDTSAGIAHDENKNRSSGCGPVNCGGSSLFCGQPSYGYMEAQRG